MGRERPFRGAALAGAAALMITGFGGAAEAQPMGDILIGDGSRIHPESIATTPDGGLLIGSVAGPNVYRYRPGDDAATLWVTIDDVIEDGIVVGVFAHEDTAWVCANAPFSGPSAGTVVAFSLETAEQIGAYPFPGGGLCNDFAASPDGTLIVTDTSLGGPALGRVMALVEGEDGEMIFRTIVAGSSIGGVDGLAFMGDTLFVNDVTANKLYRIGLEGTDLVSFETLTLSQPIAGPDGMRTTEDGSALLLTENASGRLSRVTIDGDTANVEVIAEGFGQVTGVAQLGNTAYVVVAAFDALFNPEAPDPGPFHAIAVDLGM